MSDRRALHGGRQVADRPAEADDALTARLPALERLAHTRAHLVQLLLCSGLIVRQEFLGEPHRAQWERIHLERLALGDLCQLEAPAAEVEHHAVGEGRRVDRGDVAEVRLVASGQDLDLQPGRLLGEPHELGPVGGLADRARGHRDNILLFEAAGAAEVLKHRQGFQPTFDRLVAEPPGSAQPGSDPNRLVQLVDVLPPLLAVGVDDHAP